MSDKIISIIDKQIADCKNELVKHKTKFMEEQCFHSREMKLVYMGQLNALIQVRGEIQKHLEEEMKEICL